MLEVKGDVDLFIDHLLGFSITVMPTCFCLKLTNYLLIN